MVIEICSASNALEAHRFYEKHASELKDWQIFIAGESDSESIKLLDLTLGNFELNACKPLIAHNFLQSVRLLSDGMDSFEQHCVRGLEVQRERITDLLGRSLMLVTALVPHIGYDRTAEIAKLAQGEGLTLRAAVLALGRCLRRILRGGFSLNTWCETQY